MAYEDLPRMSRVISDGEIFVDVKSLLKCVAHFGCSGVGCGEHSLAVCAITTVRLVLETM